MSQPNFRYLKNYLLFYTNIKKRDLHVYIRDGGTKMDL
jgi:hypothetical protein